MTDTFFDLQRFAVLVGGQSSFSWKDGETFAAGASTAIGTSSNPAYLVAKGGALTAGDASSIYLSGEKSYSFSLDGETDWSLKLSKDGVAQVTNGEDGLALGTLNDTAAVLDLNGIFDEEFNGHEGTYIKGDTDVTIKSFSAGVAYQFDKNITDVEVAVNSDDGIQAQFGKGAANISLGLTEDDMAKGFGFEKAATVGGRNGELTIYTENNTVTVPGGNVWNLKKLNSGNMVSYNVANGAVDSVLGIKGATLTSADGVKAPVAVGSNVAESTVWNEISGGISTIAFDSIGAADIDNTGAVTVKGQAGAEFTIAELTTAGVTANGIKVQAADEAVADVGFELETVEGGGISAINFAKAQDGAITVKKDDEFSVNIGKSTTYDVTTDADSVTFEADKTAIDVTVAADKAYAVAGGDAEFKFADAIKAGQAVGTSINAATVEIKNNADDANAAVVIASDKDEAGISEITGLKAGDSVNVANDADGYTAVFNSTAGTNTLTANGASIQASTYGQEVSMIVNGNDVTISGLTGVATVAAGTGFTYHFKDGKSTNSIVASDGIEYVTLDSSGNVSDHMDEANHKKLMENDAEKWFGVATIGNDHYIPDEDGDTVPANRSSVYEDFYDLATSNVAGLSVAGYANENSDTAEAAANSTGVTFTGNTVLGSSAHVTMTTGSSVGAVPINIQRNESSAAKDVKIDLTSSTVPSTLTVGTLGLVSASHEIRMSNTGVGYAFVGSGATGQNKIFAGTGGSQIRHNGERASITGNSGQDTIWAGKHDIVTGGTGADAFYDTNNYTVQDYNATEGDVLIATRLHSIDEVNKANLNFGEVGNEIGFGTSNKTFTLGQDQNASLYLKVAVMDTDANLIGSRNVVVAGQNGGAVDASAVDGAALIVADEDRNDNAGDVIVGSAYNDTVYVGDNDAVAAGAGNDLINIGTYTAGDAGAAVALSAGNDTVKGWNFGFDQNAGANRLLVEGDYAGRFDNDRLMIYTANGSMLFDGTEKTNNHGQYDILINDKKYMAIRTIDNNNTNPTSFGYVTSNDGIADYYLAEREGNLLFSSAVTQDLGLIDLTSENYQGIRVLSLGNNSNAVVLGSGNRESLYLGGDASVGASKVASLGTGDDVIISGGGANESLTSGHTLIFGEGDGRDTIANFSHYLGVDVDPDKQYADTLVIEAYTGLKVERHADGDRIEIGTGDESRVVLYETGDNAVNVNNMYQIKVGEFDTKVAKIGFSDAANNFDYSKKVGYYIGNSAENAADTITIGDGNENVELWLDGSKNNEFYRGIAAIDASTATNTNLTMAGGTRNDTITAGGAGTTNFMWGGTGDNVLNGGDGNDYFMYYKNAGAYIQGADATQGGGNDEVNNYDFDNDVIWLGDITLDDINVNATSIGTDAVTIGFNNGGSLTINGTQEQTRVFTQDGIYIADKSTGNWSREG